MHLQAIRLRGFKSFPDEVEVRLERGVAVIVGPNGSGKSNVADGLLWSTGSLSPTELRAEKPDDVLFNGNDARQAAKWCEVELRFDNGDGSWTDLPYSEVSIMRRLHRGGEGQYLVNGSAVRRTDLVELLADVGLASGVTVIGQGKVEEILGSSPAQRRAMIEEAAGVGRFKRRRHRAELKLARVAIEVERAKDVEAEVQKRLRPLALQASAAERAEKLRGEVDAAAAPHRRPGAGRGRIPHGRRSMSGAPPPRSSADATTSGSSLCSATATGPRRSWPMRPAAASRQPARSIDCAVPSTA